MTSAFDPNSFLDAQQSEANEKRLPIPEDNPADEYRLYTAVIGEIKATSGMIEKGDKAGQPWVSMVIPLRIQLPSEVQAAYDLPPELTISDRAFLDLTPSGSVDNAKGKNRAQKTYRDACDMNKPGEPFAWRMLQGRVVKVKIKHEMYEGNIQERIGGVFPG